MCWNDGGVSVGIIGDLIIEGKDNNEEVDEYYYTNPFLASIYLKLFPSTLGIDFLEHINPTGK